jgi:hypothetical protein
MSKDVDLILDRSHNNQTKPNTKNNMKTNIELIKDKANLLHKQEGGTLVILKQQGSTWMHYVYSTSGTDFYTGGKEDCENRKLELEIFAAQ